MKNIWKKTIIKPTVKKPINFVIVILINIFYFSEEAWINVLLVVRICKPHFREYTTELFSSIKLSN